MCLEEIIFINNKFQSYNHVYKIKFFDNFSNKNVI